MHPSHSSDDDLDRNAFGPLLCIPETSFIQLATNIRFRVFNSHTSRAAFVTRIAGSYNLIHILQLDDLKLVIRVPATGWADGMTDDAARALESEVTTLRLLATKTSIPVPKVIAFDTTCDNDIKAPYLCMSFVPGQSVSKAWFDSTGPTSVEERRLRILKTLSGCMAQLSRFRFQKIGSLHSMEDGSLFIGPCYDYHENDDGTLRVVASGPFDTAASYLKERRAKENTKSAWGISASKLLDAMIPYLPAYDSAEGFVLRPPDFDSQNVMVDDAGNVTGIIDWDHVQTLPQCIGYSIYPSWITRDWNPLMYGWPKLADSEDSPQELERYRAYYNQQMGVALGQDDWIYTEKSHVRQAIWIAALSGECRLGICRKLVQTVVDEDLDATDILYDLGTDRLSETDWSTLKSKLGRLISW